SLRFLSVLDGETREAFRGDRARAGMDTGDIERLISDRLAARASKDFATSDRIRDELAASGIRLKDGKDPATGEAVTTWELAD
ncbi:MAG: cysteine--tRNA ligase, partial [Pseudomonadota bacterium]